MEVPRLVPRDGVLRGLAHPNLPQLPYRYRVRCRSGIPCESLPERPQAPDTSNEVHDLVDRLPIEQREVVALCGLLGYEYEAAAELLGVPIGTVRSPVVAARATILELLTAGDEEVTA